MDHLRRLIASLLFALGSLGAWASGTVATIPGSTGYVLQYAGLTSATYTTPQGTCVEAVSMYYAAGGTCSGATLYSSSNSSCTISRPSCGTLGMGIAAVSVPASCPANSTMVSGACTCSSGYVPNVGATACVALGPPVCPVKKLGDTQLGPFTSQANMMLGWSSCQAVAATDTTVAGGCKHSYDWYFGAEAAAGWYGTFRESVTGATCTPNGGGFTPDGGSGTPPPAPAPPASAPDPSAPLPTPPASSCAAGTCPGTVNGASMCVACTGGWASAGTGTGTSNPAGAASAPGGGTGTTAGNAGGGTTPIPSGGSSLSSTTCTAGLCVTQTFIRDAGGSVVGQNTASSPQTTYCANNRGDPICVAQNTGANGTAGTGGSGGSGSGAASAPASSFGGSCGAGFTCGGDAVQCAIARDQLARNCQTLEAAPSNDPAVLAAAAGDQPSWHPAKNGTTTSLSGGFDQTNILSGGCPSDMSVAVSHFGNVSIPFSTMCTPATYLGNILVGLTALSCIGIVFVRGK